MTKLERAASVWSAGVMTLAMSATAWAGDGVLVHDRMSTLKLGTPVINTAGRAETLPPGNVPIAGFEPKLAVSYTTAQSSDDFVWQALSNPSRFGTVMGGGRVIAATLDSGGQSHILSNLDYEAYDFAGAGREGTAVSTAIGASGQEDLLVSDPVGVFAAGLGNVPVSGGTGTMPNTAFKGQYNVSTLSAEPGSVLPNIVGLPMFHDYAVDIRNRQTYRRTIGGNSYRGPNIVMNPIGSGPNYPLKITLTLQDANGAAASAPTFIPSLSNFNNWLDDPNTPTFWTFPFAKADVSHTGGSRTDQRFLFDTGAQVSVVSEQLADILGFDVGTDVPDFVVPVLGVGGVIQVPGFYMNSLNIPATGGSLNFNNVPVLVLNIVDPGTGPGSFVPGIIGMNLFHDRDLNVNLSSFDPFVRVSNPLTEQWSVDAAGNWSNADNWTLGVPDVADAKANFIGAITAPRTVVVDTDHTLGSMKFNNASTYTIQGPGRLSLSSTTGPSTIDVQQGSHVVSANLSFDDSNTINVNAGSGLSLSGDTASPAATVTKQGFGPLSMKAIRLDRLNVYAGTVNVIAAGNDSNTSVVKTLDVNGGVLNIADAKFIVDYTGATPLSDVRSDLSTSQITTSLANRVVGYAEASAIGVSTFGGVSVDASAVLLRATLAGDTDLNGNVNFADLLKVAQTYGTSGFWQDGDFDYDGAIGFADLLKTAQNYGLSLLADGGLAGTVDAARFAADWQLALSMVPEPTSIVAVVAMSALSLRRRRV
jgi:hypothetical protein